VVGLFIGQRLNLQLLDPLMAMAVSVIVLKMGGEMVYKAGRGL